MHNFRFKAGCMFEQQRGYVYYTRRYVLTTVLLNIQLFLYVMLSGCQRFKGP